MRGENSSLTRNSWMLSLLKVGRRQDGPGLGKVVHCDYGHPGLGNHDSGWSGRSSVNSGHPGVVRAVLCEHTTYCNLVLFLFSPQPSLSPLPSLLETSAALRTLHSIASPCCSNQVWLIISLVRVDGEAFCELERGRHTKQHTPLRKKKGEKNDAPNFRQEKWVRWQTTYTGMSWWREEKKGWGGSRLGGGKASRRQEESERAVERERWLFSFFSPFWLFFPTENLQSSLFFLYKLHYRKERWRQWCNIEK